MTNEALISKAAMSILTRLKAAEDHDELDDTEVVCEGRTCYIGLDTVSKAKVWELLRLCLLRDSTDQGGKMERYELNEEGRKMVDDPKYMPLITRHLAQREPAPEQQEQDGENDNGH